MVRKWKLGATGSAVLATAFVIVACSSKSDDDSGSTGTGGSGGKGGTGGGAGTTSGTAGKAATGGTSGTGTGGTGGTAGTGTTTGGSGGATGGTAGAAGASAGAAATGPYACKNTTPTCNSFQNFSVSTSAWWGSGDFNGGFSTYGSGLTRDMTVTDKIHITGMVSTYSGFNFWFANCSNLSTYMGVSFVLDGTSPSATTPNTLSFNPQTNSDYPFEGTGVDPSAKKGSCTPTDMTNPFGSCLPAGKSVTLGPTATMVLWADVETTATGSPVKFTAAMSPGEILGLQWQFPWDSTATAYAVDVTLDNLSFIGGTPMDCGTTYGSAGAGAGGSGAGGASTGGMGGAAAGGGGMSAGAGGVMGGMGGAAAGAGGMTGGMGGKASGGMGGATGGKSGGGGKAAGGKAGGA